MKKFIQFFLTVSLAFGNFALPMTLSPVYAQTALSEGVVVKARGHAALYYIGSGNKRYVFPNENIFFTWYNDFSKVAEVDAETIAKYTLAGNVQYRPGVVLIKLQSDPRVYAVSPNGELRWVKTEAVAKKLYGEKWNLLIDDVLDSFFAGYKVAAAIEDESSFNPDEEENIALTISENMDAKIREKSAKRMKKNLDFCARSEKQINRVQERASRRGIKIEGLGEEFFKQCVKGREAMPSPSPSPAGKKEDKKDEKKDEKKDDKKITLCHIPPGNPSARQTISVGLPAARAHLRHGDILGACAGGTPDDITLPVLSNIRASSTSPTAEAILWTTNEPATSKVLYALEPLSQATTTKSVSDAALVTSHNILLTNLSPAEKYYFMVESKDAAGNTATSTEMMFTTGAQTQADTTAPQISAVAATSITASSTIILWSTDEPATTKVNYAGKTLSTATTTFSFSDNTLVTSHSALLTGLASTTQYFFMVESKDASGNTATSTEGTFTTTP